jgi:hypothetical protein
MQDRYAGDVGDFGKLGMLRKIENTGLKVGVNWYLTYKPEEHGKEDGKHTGYLNDSAFRGCDDELLESLRVIVSGRRSVAALEQANLIPGARFYSEILKPGNDNNFLRAVWHQKAQLALTDADIIFCDPDNGLIVKSVSLGSSKSDKYVTEHELFSYFITGKSVVFYNHRCREKEHLYLQRFASLQQKDELVGAKWMGLKFVRGTIRDYFFILQPYHIEQVTTALERLLQSNWNKHFTMLDI